MCRALRGQVWAETPPVHNHLVLRQKDRNWKNAEVRQRRKATCEKEGLQMHTVKKGDAFHFGVPEEIRLSHPESKPGADFCD